MDFKIRQINSLEKVRNIGNIKAKDITYEKVFANEVFSYQVVISSKERIQAKVSVDSLINEYVELYVVKDTVMDFPVNIDSGDSDFLTKDAGVMPDLLIPLAEQENYIKFSDGYAVIWVRVKLPESLNEGVYTITLNFDGNVVYKPDERFKQETVMHIEKLKYALPEQEIIYTQWFHTDCIASAHLVKIYSEEHWELIDKYMKMAADTGVNMILTPVITPPLDTAEGHKRPCTQLVGIYNSDGRYSFDFTLLRRWIGLCRKNGIRYLEISHLFTQWGLHAAPNIVVNENGREYYKFGWHTNSQSEEYKQFLLSFLPELVKVLKDEQVFDKCYFHLSDEPQLNDIERYEYAFNLVKPFIEDRPIMDAVSKIDFYNKGFITVPVTAINHIEPFLEKKIKNQWAYYCCVQDEEVSNRFMAMPSYRNRILGIQMYKYDIKGFLQWGFNFYYSQYSLYSINPYITSSADKAFPSGDAFSVYPGQNGPMLSLRAVVFKEALQDMEFLRILEKQIGKEQVIKLIEEEARTEITFRKYPRNSDFLFALRNKIKEIILSK